MSRITLSMVLSLVLVGAALAPSPALSGGGLHGTDVGFMASGKKAPGNNPVAMPPNSTVEGKSYSEWAAAYIQYALAIAPAQGLFDDGHAFSLNQSGPVWFIQPGCADRSYTLPADTYLWAPVLFAWNEYPCPDPSFQPAPGQSMEDFLRSGIAPFIAANPPGDGALVVDGRPLTNLANYRATSGLFDVTIHPDWLSFDPCVTATPQPCVTDGYWVMLKPLSVGPHTIEYPGCGIIQVNVVEANHSLSVSTAKENAGVASPTTTSWGRIKVTYR